MVKQGREVILLNVGRCSLMGETDQEIGTGNLWKVETQVFTKTHAEIRERISQ